MTGYAPTEDRVIRSWSRNAGIGGHWGLFGVVVATVALIALLQGHAASLSPFLVVVAVLDLGLGVRALTVHVRLTPSGTLHIRNPFRSYTFHATEVDAGEMTGVG